MKTSPIAITMGDPSGIGSEIILKTLIDTDITPEDIVLIGNKELFQREAFKLNTKILAKFNIIDISCDIDALKLGEPTIESGRVSFLALKTACDLALVGEISSVATAPTSKYAMSLANYKYSGQTEILQKYLGSRNNLNAEMLFVARDFRVLLLTRHIPLSKVSEFLTVENVVSSVLALHKSLISNFKISNPKIAICGLNPHAGEDGILGDEEIKIIIPAILELKSKYDVDIEGPFPGDTIWVKAGVNYIDQKPLPYDAYISCYHDQGLIPIKLLALYSTVNVTINLPIIRTSPSHGTAFDIAGQGVANHLSMKSALELASNLSG